jgi:glycosyltransferase involved in cell wall biosynthesis
MKVLLLSKYSRMGASSRLRSLQYLPALRQEGLHVRVCSLFDDHYLTILYQSGKKPHLHLMYLYLRRLLFLFTCGRYDIIWIEKEVFPYMPAFAERILQLLGKPYVVDYDDAVFHNYDLSGNSAIRALLGKKIDVVMRGAACVVAGNSYLADRAGHAGASRVEIIPTVVDHVRYRGPSERKGQQLVIGWIGSPSTQMYVVGIREVLKKVCDLTGARVMLVGATLGVKEHLAGIPVDIIPWSEDSEANLIRQMDVGIMPLKDGPWEQGKCGYKLIQYMASGVPVVASPVGVNVEIVSTSNCGQLAGSEQEWSQALIKLLTSTIIRQDCGESGRRAVAQWYSLQVQAPVLAKILRCD